MIRILQVVTYMSRAGIETMLMNYYRHIDRTKVQFDFLCNSRAIGAYEEEIKELGGRIYRTPGLNPFKYILYLKFMKRFIKDHPEYKIIHAHNDAFAAYSLFAAKCYGIPNRIAHVHNAAFPFNYKLPIYYFCRLVLPYCCTLKWSCGKKAARFYYGEKVYQQHDYHVHNNAIDIRKFSFNREMRETIRNQYHISNDEKVIGHIGRFFAQKNHIFIIKLFDKIIKDGFNARLMLVGDGPLMLEIKEKVKKIHLEDKVLFVGSVNNTCDYYQAFDLFTLPSLHEGLPVSGIEAQAADLPCVFSTAVTDEVAITPKVSFLNLKDSLEIWASKIESMISSNNKREDKFKEISDAGFDINKESEKLVCFYTDLYNKSK